jgi:proline dehydrogenase
MALMRNLLLAGSTSPWLKAQATRRAFVRRSVSKFMPGERFDDALSAATAQAKEGINAIFTQLGENLTRADQAEAVTEHYLDVLQRISAASLDAHIAVKPTQLGLDFDAVLCRRNLDRLLAKADEVRTFVWLDMESSPYVDPTLELFRRARERTPRIGIALQSYLHRTPSDVEQLLPLGAAIRLVKGAYLEPASVALPQKRDVDEAFYRLSCRLLSDEARRTGVRLHIATHDVRLIDRLLAHIDANRVPASVYDFAMLYGIQREQQQRLARASRPIRVLIAYGEHWFAWYMRRLAERPANVMFVIRNMFG